MSRNILLINDDPDDAVAIREALANACDGFEVHWVRRCSDALTRLALTRTQEADDVAAVLADVCLPDSEGIETFERLHDAAPRTPVVLLCAPYEEDVARRAVQLGAKEYLLKGVLYSYVLPRVLRAVIDCAVHAEALLSEKERAQVTLDVIGDAVITTDTQGRVNFLNAVAESMTGWSLRQAAGHSLGDVFKIVDGTTRAVMWNPIAQAVLENRTTAVASNCILIRRDGHEAQVEDSVTPLHDRWGRTSGAVVVFHDVSATHALSDRMSHLAQHDSLTDLPNRVLFNDRLAQALVLAQRHRKKLAVLFLDLDRFKHVNDSMGHAIGDRVLQSVAQRLLACVRSSDTVSRVGGDEFVILLSEMNHAQEAAIIADKILLALSSPHSIDQYDPQVTASIGIAAYPDDGTEADVLIKNADFAMYYAKDAGRSNYQFFRSDMNARAVERQAIEDGLRRAIQRQDFVLHYQPKVDIKTGAISGAEALIRWRHPERGSVPPGQFIPIAEESGLVVPIGRWVLREGCRQARAWQLAGLPRIRIAINISAVDLRSRDFVSGVSAILEDTGLAPDYLELELTETFLMQDSMATAEVLHALRDIGVHFSLDDFGTGYSSLSYLKRFPIDALKIDQSFVRDLTTDADDASIVSAVIGMGRSLKMQVVAEGIETQQQLDILREQGCPAGQGYYFSRPVAAKDFAKLLVRGFEPASIDE